MMFRMRRGKTKVLGRHGGRMIFFDILLCLQRAEDTVSQPSLYPECPAQSLAHGLS